MLNDYIKDNKRFISNHFKSVIFGYIGSYESSKFTKLLLKIRKSQSITDLKYIHIFKFCTSIFLRKISHPFFKAKELIFTITSKGGTHQLNY